MALGWNCWRIRVTGPESGVYAVLSFCIVPLRTAAQVIPLPDRHKCAFVQPSYALLLFLRQAIQTITSFQLNVSPQNQKEICGFRHFAEFLRLSVTNHYENPVKEAEMDL